MHMMIWIKYPVDQGYGYTVRLEDETGSNVGFHIYDAPPSTICTYNDKLCKYIASFSGTNCIKVYRSSGLNLGHYNIRVLPAYWNEGDYVVWDEFYEPNPTFYNAYLLYTNGVEYFNKFEYQNDNDFFRFFTEEDSTYTITLTEENGANAGFHVYYERPDRTLQTIATYRNIQYEFTAANTGTYVIMVYSSGGLSQGDYKINVIGPLSGYEAELRGTVTAQSSGTPVADAVVRLKPVVDGGYAVTNSSGNWIMRIPAGQGYNLEIIAKDYDLLKEENLNFPRGETTFLSHQLIGNSVNYDEYRIVPVALAPNPDTIKILEGGIGYAWFVIEGRYTGNNWLPVPNIEIMAKDEQNNLIECQSNWLPFQFLTVPFYFQNLGAFAVPVPANHVQNGTPGSQETVIVFKANGVDLSVQNQASIPTEVIPYQYTANWGYRKYGKAGAGATAGILTGTRFIGGGSGSTIEIELEGLNANPDWSKFKILRRNDFFLGAEIRLGPPKFINTNIIKAGIEGTADVKRSFPYQEEYEFNIDSLAGMEALMAFYLFKEPSILYAGSRVPGRQIGVSFLTWAVEAIIANAGQNGLDLVRIADQSGIDIEGNISCSAEFGFNLTNQMQLTMGPSLGAHAHFSSSIESTIYGKKEKRIAVGGGYDFNGAVGPKFIPVDNPSVKFTYPFRLNQRSFPSNLAVEFEYFSAWQDDSWESFTLSAGLESNSSAFNIYNLPGQTQVYKSYIQIQDEDVKNLLFNAAELPSEIWNIGSSAVNLAINNADFKNDFVEFLDAVYEEQNDDLPTRIAYGFEAEDKSEYKIDIDLEFPIPVFPPIIITLGGGLEATNAREYSLSQGYWVKGMPYLQTEMPDPPYPQETFTHVISALWDSIREGSVWRELKDVVVAHLSNKFFKWIPFKAETQIVQLNDRGSVLTIRENSIPASMDSVITRYWEWEDSTQNRSAQTLTHAQEQLVKNYIKGLREIREEAVGLNYGIGGFFSFEPHGEAFEDSTQITIVYTDECVDRIDESVLKVYCEDSTGTWHQLISDPEPDSNRVSAWITEFSTYTLAARIPQGAFSLYAVPDSLPADGVALATITSDSLYYNDSSLVADSTLYTIQASRGTIITADVDTTHDGIQVYSDSAMIEFQIRADSVSSPITVIVSSVQGLAHEQLELPLYDVTTPDAPTLLDVIPTKDGLQVSWQGVNNPDLAGYHIYFDTDASGAPYNGTANVWGENSFVTVGLVDEYLLKGLTAEITYYIAITAFDIAGNESIYSNEMLARWTSALEIDPDTLIITASSKTDSLYVNNSGTGTMNWTVAVTLADTSWITITNGSSGTDNDTIEIDIQVNESLDRTGKIIVDADSAYNSPDTVVIIQAMPIDLILQNRTIDTGQTKAYHASNSITAAGDSTYFVVESDGATGGVVTFDAGNEIYLSTGFNAKAGGEFEANIDTNLVGKKAEAEAKAKVGDEHMTIVPIPGADGVFIIRLNFGEGEDADVQIFDTTDKMVYANKHAGDETKIDLSSQPKGTYTIKVWWGDQMFIEEIVIQ